MAAVNSLPLFWQTAFTLTITLHGKTTTYNPRFSYISTHYINAVPHKQCFSYYMTEFRSAWKNDKQWKQWSATWEVSLSDIQPLLVLPQRITLKIHTVYSYPYLLHIPFFFSVQIQEFLHFLLCRVEKVKMCHSANLPIGVYTTACSEIITSFQFELLRLWKIPYKKINLIVTARLTIT